SSQSSFGDHVAIHSNQNSVSPRVSKHHAMILLLQPFEPCLILYFALARKSLNTEIARNAGIEC
ncbi:MAG: hypothetical protein ACOC1H_04995, partial [Desulfosalsimonas sp.]